MQPAPIRPNAQVYGPAEVMCGMFRVAGPKLTRRSFVTAARTIDNYTGQLQLLGRFTLKVRQVGLLAEFPIECCSNDKTIRSLGPPKETF
jgi:hypothetical protein